MREKCAPLFVDVYIQLRKHSFEHYSLEIQHMLLEVAFIFLTLFLCLNHFFSLFFWIEWMVLFFPLTTYLHSQVLLAGFKLLQCQTSVLFPLSDLTEYIRDKLYPLRFSKYYIIRERFVIVLETLLMWLPPQCNPLSFSSLCSFCCVGCKSLIWCIDSILLITTKRKSEMMSHKPLIRCMKLSD